MKFNKTNLVAVLSLTLLLSSQAKSMGHDAELALQAPMAELPVTVVNPSLKEQAVNAFSKTKNFAIDSSKSLYGVALDNKALVAGVAGMGVGAVLYKKYPKSAIATGLIGSAVTAAALTSKYAPEAIEKGKNVAANAGNVVATFAKDAGIYTLEAAKTAGNFVAVNSGKAANFVAAHTPEFVTNAASYIENNELQVPVILGAGLVGYGAYKAFTPAKNAVKKAGQVTLNAGKTVANKASKVTARQLLAVAAPVAVVGGLGVVAYKNQEVISTMAKAVVESVSNSTVAAGQFVAKQAGKLKINGARLVEAAKNVDIKGMANNSKEFVANHKLAVGATVAVPTVIGAGYVADKYVMPKLQTLEERRGAKKLAARIANAGDVVAIASPESVIQVESMTVKVDHSPVSQAEVNAITSILDKPAKVVLVPFTKPAPAKAKSVLEQTILPGQEAA